MSENIHPGHARLREICCDTKTRHDLVRRFIDFRHLLTGKVVKEIFAQEQNFSVSDETADLIAEFVKGI